MLLQLKVLPIANSLRFGSTSNVKQKGKRKTSGISKKWQRDCRRKYQ